MLNHISFFIRRNRKWQEFTVFFMSFSRSLMLSLINSSFVMSDRNRRSTLHLNRHHLFTTSLQQWSENIEKGVNKHKLECMTITRHQLK